MAKKSLAKEFIDKSKQDEVKRQKKIIIEKIYPFLVKEKMNIEEAKTFLQVVTMSVKQQFDNLKLTTNIWELELKEKLAEGQYKERYTSILDLLADESVAKGCGMIDELLHALETFQKQENLKRPVKDLKTDWVK
jgi:hypothetical protein